jgi:urease subunit beta
MDRSLIPGEYIISDEPIIANPGRKTTRLQVSNTGDRPVQVGSHTHFFEVNKALNFQRVKAYGFRLNIPSGTSIRFEPGETKEVELTEFSGKRRVYGFGGLVNGSLATNKASAISRARRRGYKGA